MRGILAGFALLFATAACGEDALVRRYTGALEGSDAKIAVLVQDEAVLAYVCGGPTTLDSLTRWYSGQLAGDTFASTSEGVELSLRANGDELIGVVGSGQLLSFRARRTEGDSPTGLYEARTAECRTGVIVDGDTTQGASCVGVGRFAQVSPDGPVARAGFMVRVDQSAPPVRMFVEPASP